jgi:CRP/FNR family cyclic AMP-dependent transcriptional regulator
MPCLPAELKHIPLFSLLDEDELAILAAQVEVRRFAARQRIYKIGDIGKNAFVVMTGNVQVSTVDSDNQEVLLHQAGHGEFFGFASMLEETPHQTDAMAITEVECVEIDRNDISVLLQKKPMAGMDLLTVIGRQFHATQELVKMRASRNANELIDEEETFGERIADSVAKFGGSWTFIIAFAVVLIVYTAANVLLGNKRAWDPYPFILLNLFLSMLAAIQAPVIMMSQNRQDSKDRVRSELDFEVNLRAETEIQAVSGRLNLLMDKIGDLDELVRDVAQKSEKK